MGRASDIMIDMEDLIDQLIRLQNQCCAALLYRYNPQELTDELRGIRTQTNLILSLILAKPVLEETYDTDS